MKKIISLLLILTVISGLFIHPVSASEDSFYYFESFENIIESTGLPEGWTHKKKAGNKFEITDRVGAVHGDKAFYLQDDSTTYGNTNTLEMQSVTSGDCLGLTMDAYMISGQLNVAFKFYDADKKVLSSNQLKISGFEGMWYSYEKLVFIPSNAAYMELVISTTTVAEAEGYLDNILILGDYVNKKAENELKFNPPTQEEPLNAKLVEPSGDKLIYNVYDEEHGDKLSDFSYAGYYAGNLALPNSANLTQYAEVYPKADYTTDVTSEIQALVDKASKKYSETGKVQVITLKRGKYYISSERINLKSGVILKGEGQDEEGTVLYLFSPSEYYGIRVSGTKPVKIGEIAYIKDSYIPAGSDVITIDEERVSDYKAGDLITIYHPSDIEWNKALDMHGENMVLEEENRENSWDEGEIDFQTERTITKIEGNKITVDFPFFIPYDTRYSKAYIYKTDDSGRVHDSGVENLRIESYFNGSPADENHATIGIYFGSSKNCFVRDVSFKYLVKSAVMCQEGAKQITVKNCSSLQPVSEITGSRRYCFFLGAQAQQILYSGCYSYDGRHDYGSSVTSTGPNVFLDSVVDASNSQSETHGTWSTGLLYDNLMSIGNDTKGFISSVNRGTMGSYKSQGWSGAGVVAWNCLATAVALHKPPLTYQNFIIGQWGFYDDDYAAIRKNNVINTVYNNYKTNSIPAGTAPKSVVETKDGTSFIGDAYKESEFAPVNPRSLYKAQLAERITGSYKNFKPNAPVITNPRSENTEEENMVEIKGIYQKGANAVTVYIDNNPYNATLNSSDNTFSVKTLLEEGTHKIFATQAIDGVESTKTADRFIHVVKEGNRLDYLSSNFDSEFSNPLINDTRLRYDEVEQQLVLLNASLSSETTEINKQVQILIENSEYFSNISYTADVPGIVEISDDGIATAVGEGTVVITVSGNHKNGLRYSTLLTLQVKIPSDYLVMEGSGTEYDPFIVDTAYKFRNIFANNDDNSLRNGEYYFLQTEDLELGIYNSNSSAVFNGTYRGGNIDEERNITYENKKITAEISGAGNLSLFGKLEDATIANLDAYGTITSTSSTNASFATFINSSEIIRCNNYMKINGKNQTGGLIGRSDGSSLIAGCSNNEDVNGNTYTGGIIAYMTSGGKIIGCVNNGDVSSGTTNQCAGIVASCGENTLIELCANNGNISGKNYIGGIVAYSFYSGTSDAELLIEKCSNNGKITATTEYAGGIIGLLGGAYKTNYISECVNAGDIQSKNKAGGLVGGTNVSAAAGSGLDISDCINAGNVMVQATSAKKNGFAVGLYNGAKGISVKNCYDTKNAMDSIGAVEGNTPPALTENVFIINETPCIYATNKTPEELKDMISIGTFSSKIWEEDRLSGYPLLKCSFNGITSGYSENINKLVVLPVENAKLYIADYDIKGVLKEVEIHLLKSPGIFDILTGNKAFIWNDNFMPLKKIFIK